ncbi:MAG: SCO1664 family protein [Acidimicrobiales bacterium]
MPEDEREPAPAGLTPEESIEVLSAGAIEIEGRLPWSSNYSYLATVTCEARSLRAVYKPGRGERLLWDFGPDLYRREVAAYELSAALGLGLIPATVLRADGPLGPGSLQLFVDADFEQHYFSIIEDVSLHPRLREMAGLDLLLNNADRKSGHVLLDSSARIWGIDNGLSFHSQPKLRTVIWDFAGDPLPDSVLDGASTLVDSVPQSVACLLAEAEVEALCRRARAVRRSRTLPQPRDDHRSYPWPLV